MQQQHLATGKTVHIPFNFIRNYYSWLQLRPDEKRGEDKKLNKEEEEEENRNVK